MKLSELKGIGDKKEQLFNRIDLYSTNDLLNFYPRGYDAYEEPVLISEMEEEKTYALWGTVATACEYNASSRYKIISVYVADDTGNRIKLTWFNMPFLRNNLKRGYRYIFRGKVAFRGSLVFMEQPAMYGYDAYMEKLNSLWPVYRLTAGLTNNMVLKAISQCFELGLCNNSDYLSDEQRQSLGLVTREEALRGIHFPKNIEELGRARKRIVFDEFFQFTLSIRSRRTANLLEDNAYVIKGGQYSQMILNNLGYSLTGAQQKVCAEIRRDMSGPHGMNRLIQGDVGSGKTIVAFLAMVDVVEAGFQAALMAPTEVLAAQHYNAFVKLIESCKLSIRCVLLTGSLTAAEKRRAHEAIAAHEADIIIGTHALITDKVEYSCLGLVVTDEQHRFGVNQREKLQRKGVHPHIIVMSATPIPRSLAIILYGDLDISIIDEKPASRLPIKNAIVDESYRERACRFMMDEIGRGHQIYIICAMAKPGEDDSIGDVVTYSENLSKKLPENVRIRYLHGKMKPSQKDEIMSEFGEGRVDILVSTTVVEVGINVPNATVMLVENAERFGLAQLHQLRGRVGRGADQSYCIFMSSSKSKATKERLKILKDSNDGFYISEQDLKLRGPGDMLGTRQSGDFDFALGDIYTDATTLKLAADTAADILDKDPQLSMKEHEAIRQRLVEYNKDCDRRLNL